jgi:hypothetical protein
VARVIFDVIETLLDLRPLEEPFVRVLGDPAPLGEWFARLLHGSLVATVTDRAGCLPIRRSSALWIVCARPGFRWPR